MEIKQPVAHLDWRDLISAKDDTPAETIKALDAYFAPFACRPADEGQPCLECGKPLVGLAALLLGGGFEWGLIHGEGHCANCKWPARAHHFIKDEAGDDVMTIRNFVLQYHPDVVSRRRKGEAA